VREEGITTTRANLAHKGREKFNKDDASGGGGGGGRTLKRKKL
jgi:hypothetical protein